MPDMILNEGTTVDVTNSVDTLMTTAGSVLDFIMGEPLLMLLFSASLVFMSIGIVKGIKKAAKK